MLILHLAIAIAIILVCIIVLKLNASIGMVLACLYMGGMGGLGLMDTVSTISSGFGNMMTGIGLPIGFGVILGQLLNDSGAAGVIADKIVSDICPASTPDAEKASDDADDGLPEA